MRPLRGNEDDGGGGRWTGIRTGSSGETKAWTPASSSRLWVGVGDPRIVRVSGAFGGKDRHSKVCTVKGLRDRRVRLSVPTAIQLYDLQDRLGLSQPSKVVDWLLAATKDEIDKLPPLPMPPPLGEGPGVDHAPPPPATALCMANGEGGGSVGGYTDGSLSLFGDRDRAAAGAPAMFTSTCFDVGGTSGGVARAEEPAPPLSLLPGGPGQLSFCTPGAMAAAPAFARYAPYTTASANLAVNSFHSDFSSPHKSSLFSNKSPHK